jgi:hypothetical protein
MNRKRLAIILLVIIILFLLFGGRRSGFSGSSGMPMAFSGTQNVMTTNTVMAPAIANAAPVPQASGGGMPAAMDDGISSAALIPREVVGTDDFGQYDPSAILSGQIYLDPRSQIGYPETLGGVLRNANRQERSEPLNPRDPVSIFNLSTISPDIMRPKFEIDFEYQ